MNTNQANQTPHLPPDWAFEFHGHQCPFMPLGYRMSKLAMARLGVEHELDHGFYVFPELGEAHPQTCLMDGIQVATGATYGKLTIAKTFYGKLAATFYHPKKGAVRYSIQPDFVDALGKFEFFVYRKKGIEPSQILLPVRQEIIHWTYAQPDEAIYKVEDKPEFTYTPRKGSFNKTKCSVCGEYVFISVLLLRANWFPSATSLHSGAGPKARFIPARGIAPGIVTTEIPQAPTARFIPAAYFAMS